MLTDLRYALRLLVPSPGFTISALLVLTLGIGATTTMFGATNSVLMRPLPYPDADHLYVMWETRAAAGFEQTVVSAGEVPGLDAWTTVIRDPPSSSYPGWRSPSTAPPIVSRPCRCRPSSSVVRDHAGRGQAVRPGCRGARPRRRAADQPSTVAGALWWPPGCCRAHDPVEGRPSTIVGVLPPKFSFQMRVDLIVPMTLRRGADRSRQQPRVPRSSLVSRPV